MHDLIETGAVILSIAIVLGPIIGFILFMRTLARKEREILRQYGLDESEV